MERSPMPAALQRLMAGLAAGLVMAVIEIFVEVSFATLMFTGDLKEFAGLAIGLCLAGSCIYTLFAVAMSSSRSAIAVVQETPLVAITAILAALTPAMGAATAEQQLATALAVIACFSSLAGLCFWLLGRFQLGQLLRFIPYPVVGGFLAGTGMLLVTGGISVMVDAALSWQLLLPGSLIHWLPGVVYGLGLLLLLSRFQQFWMMPLLLVAGIMGFTGIDLKLSTSIVFSIAFGIAVDDTIHFISKFRIELKKGLTVPYALKRTFFSTGKAIIVTTVILAGGFMTLVLSEFGGTFYTGLLVGLTLIFAVIIDLTLLPVLLLLFFKRRI